MSDNGKSTEASTMADKRKLFKRSDIILICVILITAASVYAIRLRERTDAALSCVISFDGIEIKTVDLSQNAVFWLDKRPAIVFEVRNNSIAFIESDCPDKVCIGSGFLRHSGQMAACLPNLVSIRITGSSVDLSPDDADMIAY